MSAQVETVDEQPPRDGIGKGDLPAAEQSKGDGGGPAGLEDFLYVDVDVEESAKRDSSSDAGGGGGGGGLGTEAAAVAGAAATGTAAAAPAMVAPADGRGLVASASKELLAKLVKSLSTPMMDGTKPRCESESGPGDDDAVRPSCESDREVSGHDDNNADADADADADAAIGAGTDLLRGTLAKQSRPAVGRGHRPRNLAASRLDDWAGVEDPDWKANHQLSWEQLTDVREIGKGLTCTVYTARIPGRKVKVIAKVARPRNKGRLEDQAERQLEAEFNVLRQANHAHVVELLGAGFTPEGRRFILLEHLPEGTLGTFHALSAREEMPGPSAYWTIKNGFRRLTKDLSYTLGRVLQVAEALQYLHNDAIPGAMVLHRDIRPDNVGLARGGVVKIFDFGLSKAVVKDHKLVGEAGSLRYSAPEVSMALPHGDRADVYSWALLAWSVASGRTPFEGIGRSAFYSRVVIGGERPELDHGWPKEFQEVLKDCWNGDPSLRPEMTEVVIRMKALLHSFH